MDFSLPKGAEDDGRRVMLDPLSLSDYHEYLSACGGGGSEGGGGDDDEVLVRVKYAASGGESAQARAEAGGTAGAKA